MSLLTCCTLGRGRGGPAASTSNTRPQPSNSIGDACLGKTVDVPNNQKFVYQEPEEVRGRPLMILGEEGPEEHVEINLIFPHNSLSKYFFPGGSLLHVLFLIFFPLARPLKFFFSIFFFRV